MLIRALALSLTCAALAAQSSDWILEWDALQRQAAHPAGRAQVAAVLGSDGPAWQRGRALVVLAAVDPSAAQKPILAAAASDQAVLRAAAAEAAGSLADGDTKGALEKLLKDADRGVALAAAESLARRDGESAWRQLRDVIGELEPERALQQGRILAEIGGEGAAAKWDIFREQAEGRARGDLVQALGWGEGVRWRLRIQNAMLDGNHEEAIDAGLALADGEYAALVQELLEDPSQNWQQHALKMLLDRPSQRGLAVVERMLEAGSFKPGYELRFALDLLRGDVTTVYDKLARQYLGDEDREVRQRAIRLAAGIEDDQQLFALLAPAVGDGDLEVARTLYRVLATTTTEAPEGGILDYVAPLLAKSNKDHIRLGLNLVQQRLGDDEQSKEQAIAALKPFLSHEDKDVREDAREALVQAGGWRVAQTLGFVARWRLIGPWANDLDNGGFATALPPERGVDLAATYPPPESHVASVDQLAWAEVGTDARGYLLLHSALPPPVETNVAFAYAEFSLPRPTKGKIRIEGDDSIAVWLDGKELARAGGERTVDEEQRKKSRLDRRRWWDEQRKEHGGWKPAAEAEVEVTLGSGRHRLLVKSANLDIYWWLRVRLLDADGKALEVDW